MTPGEFLRFVRPLPEPLLLLSGDGRILAANPAAGRLVAPARAELAGVRLAELAADAEEHTAAYLRACAASGSPVPGALTLGGNGDGDGAPRKLRCEAYALPPASLGDGREIVLRLRSQQEASERFLLLNQKIEELTRETHERRRAEAALRESERRSAFLAEASRLLAGSLDYGETLGSVARLATPEWADWCAVDLVGEDGGLQRVAIHHADPEKVALARLLQERYPPDPDAPQGARQVVRSGQPLLVPEVPDSLLEASARDAEHLRLLRTLGLRSVIVVPLTAPERVLGAVTVAFAESGRQYGEGDLALLAELGRRAAVTIENALLVRELRESRQRVEEQATELEAQTEELQAQAVQLEEQTIELEHQLDTVRTLNAELHDANEALAAAGGLAEEARAAAEAAERDVRGVLESIGDPFVVHDARWRFRYINAAAAAIFRGSGHDSADDLIGRVLWEVYPEIEGTLVSREMRRAVAERAPLTVEEHDPERGTWSEMRCYPLPDGGLSTVWKDVTGRKRAEAAERILAEAGRVLASTLDPEATLRGVARLVVPALADYCFIDVEEAGGFRRIASVHADPARDGLMRLAERYPPTDGRPGHVGGVIRTGQPLLVPGDALERLEAAAPPDPEYLRLLRELAPRSFLVVPLGTGVAVLGALTLAAAESGRAYSQRDVELAEELARRAALAIERARLFEAERGARAEAERASLAKSQFMAVMSHELRTPLNAILGYADLLDAEVSGPLNGQQHEHLRRLQGSARHLRELIDQVLSLARIEAGREELHVEPVDLAELARETVSLLEPLAGKHGLGLRFAGPREAVPVETDAGKVRQIFLNLLGNAIKFTEAGTVELGLDPAGEAVLCRVRDTGVGIAPGDLERIFEPFTQVDASSTRRVGGTGLGLPVSRRLARLLGGDLSVESTPGEGSTFTLFLPVRALPLGPHPGPGDPGTG